MTSCRCAWLGVLRREAASPEEYQLVDGYAEGVQVSLQAAQPALCAKSPSLLSQVPPSTTLLFSPIMPSDCLDPIELIQVQGA